MSIIQLIILQKQVRKRYHVTAQMSIREKTQETIIKIENHTTKTVG